MNIANVITLIRIVLTPIFMRLYLEGEHTEAMCLLAVAALSDMLDGFIARRFNMVSALGKVLDPVADKLLQLAMLLCLLRIMPAVLPLLLLHLLRETGLFALGCMAYKRCGVLTGARWYGKLCTVCMYTVLGGALMWPGMPEKIIKYGIGLCAGLVLLCMRMYAMVYIRFLKNREERKA